MELLPDEMLVNILLRLPAKSVGRSRCVSKPWNSLLSQPHFIKTHLNRTKHLPKQEETLILVSYYSCYLYSTQLRIAHQLFDEMSTFATNLSIDDQCLSAIKIKNVACCDGLILVWDDANKLVLFNPTTKESHELITPSYDVDHYPNYFTNGLGYDSFSDDYKVVSISYHNVYYCKNYEANQVNYGKMFVDVYSVKNGTWKQVESSPSYHALNSYKSGVFVDGYIHWPAIRISDDLHLIVAFDLKEEKFREIIFPSWIHEQVFVGSQIVALGGCLSMYPHTIAILSYGIEPMEIWVMKEHGVTESWTKYNVLDSLGMSVYRPQCLLGDHQVVMEKDDGLGQRGVNKLVVYDWDKNTYKDIVVHGVTDEFFVGGTSVESLVSPYPHGNTRAVRCLVPKDPSRRALSRFIALMNLDSFALCRCILVLVFLVAAIVEWLPDLF